MKALEDLTIDEVIESAEIYGVGPEETATGIQKWRTAALKYGSEQFKDDPTEYWKRSASVEKESTAALERMNKRAGVELLSSLPDNQRKPFIDRYNEVGGEPTKMVNDEWAIKAMEFNKLVADDTFKIRKAAPVTLQAEGQDLATMALRDRGDDTWEALVMPLKEGSKPFSLQIPKPNAEQLKERGDQVQKEFDHLEAQQLEAATRASQDPSVTVSESLERSIREKSQELALVRSGDLRALALNDAGKMIKADDAKMEQIADTSLWDRLKAGTMTAAIGTGRAMRASGIDWALEEMTGEKWGAPGADPFPGYEEALAQTSRDTARGFLPTTREKIERGAAESIGMMSATVLPAGAATRLAGGVVSELGAASAMAPMSAGQEWKAMHDMAAEARSKGDEEGAQRIESMAGWSALLQGTIDTLTEATFGETARAFKGGKQAIRNALLAGPKEAVEEIEAGVAERGVKQQAFYPEEKRQPVGEGLVVEAGAGAVAGYAMTAPQTLLGGIFSRQPQTQQEQIETQRRIATTAAPDAGTAQKVDEIHDRAKDWDILNQRRAAPPVYAPPEEAPVETPVEPLYDVEGDAQKAAEFHKQRIAKGEITLDEFHADLSSTESREGIVEELEGRGFPRNRAEELAAQYLDALARLLPAAEVKEESLTPAAGEVLTPPPAVEEQPVSPPAEEPITPSPDAIQEPGPETETLRDQAGVGEGVRVEDTEGQEVAGEGAPEETEAVTPPSDEDIRIQRFKVSEAESAVLAAARANPDPANPATIAARKEFHRERDVLTDLLERQKSRPPALPPITSTAREPGEHAKFMAGAQEGSPEWYVAAISESEATDFPEHLGDVSLAEAWKSTHERAQEWAEGDVDTRPRKKGRDIQEQVKQYGERIAKSGKYPKWFVEMHEFAREKLSRIEEEPAAPAEEQVPPVPVQRVEEESGFSAPLVEPQPTVEPSVEQAEVTPEPPVEEAPAPAGVSIRQQVDKESGQINYQVVVPKEMAEKGVGRIGNYALRVTPRTPEGDYIFQSGYYPSPQRALEQLDWQLRPERGGVTAGSAAEHEASHARHEAVAEPVRRAIGEAFRPLIKGPLNKALDAHQAKGTPAIWLDDTLITPTGKYTVKDGKLKKEQDLTQSGFERNLSSIEGATDTEGYIWAANQAAKDLMAKRAEEREEERKAEEAKAQKEREAQAAKAAEREKYAAEVRAVELPKGKKADVTIPQNDRAGNVMEPKQVPMTVHGNLAVKRNEEKHKGAPKFVVTHVPSGLRVGNPDLNTLEAAKDYMRALIHTGVDLSKKTFSTEDTNKLGQSARAWNNNEIPQWWSEPAPAKAKTKAKAKGKAKAKTTEESGDTRYSLAAPAEPRRITRNIGRNDDFAQPPTDEEAIDALEEPKKSWFGKARDLIAGTLVGLRIDIPAWLDNGVYVQTIHKQATPGNVGDRIGYDTHVVLKGPVRFFVKGGPKGVVSIKKGMEAREAGRKPDSKLGEAKSKFPVATVEGAISDDQTMPESLEGYTAVGFDPRQHAFFYDKRTDEKVIGGEDAVSVGNTVFVKNPVYDVEGRKTEAYSVATPTQAKPVSEARAQQVAKKVFNGRTPSNVTFINDPNARTPEGKPWAGRANRANGQITINLAFVQDEADLEERLKEEAVHLVYQDPVVQTAVANLEKAVTDEMLSGVAKLGYDPSVQTEEAAVRLVQQLGENPDTRGLLRKLYDAVANAFRKLFRMEPSRSQVEAAARQVMARALAGRTTTGTSADVRYADAVDAEYMAAHEAGDVGTMQRIINEVARRVGFDTDMPLWRGFAKNPDPRKLRTRQGRSTLSFTPVEEVAKLYSHTSDMFGITKGKGSSVRRFFSKFSNLLDLRDLGTRASLWNIIEESFPWSFEEGSKYGPADMMALVDSLSTSQTLQDPEFSASRVGSMEELWEAMERAVARNKGVDDLAETLEYLLDSVEVDVYAVVDDTTFINQVRSFGRDSVAHRDTAEAGAEFFTEKTVAGRPVEDVEGIDVDDDFSFDTYRPVEQNTVKIADAVVRDDQGNVIPPSERFDLTNPDIRYSLSEVFGQQTDQPTKGDSYKAAETIAKAQFFDGDRPIDPQATFEATSEIYGWSAATVARLLAMGQGQTNTGEDSKAIVGKGQVELFRYAHRLAATGDSSLFDHMMIYAPKWVQMSGLGENLTAEELGALLGSRASGLEKSATMQAAVGVGSTREEAETKNLPKEFVDDVDAEIAKTKLTAPQVRKVKDDATNAQGTSIAQTVQDLADEVPEEDKTALGYIDRIDKSQVEFIPAPPKPNPVRDYIKKQEDLQTQRPKDDFIKSTIAGLEHLGVSPHVARETAERVWLVHEARRDAKIKIKDINTGVEAFISKADEEQTETRIPPKEKNIAVQTIQAAVANRDAAVEEDEFRKALTADLRKVGVTHSNAVNAAARAWQVRATQMANEARKAAEAEAERQRREAEAPNRVAQSYIDKVDESQVEFIPTPPQPNPVRDYLRKQENLPSQSTKDYFVRSTAAGLEALGVDPNTARETAERVWLVREARRDAKARPADISQGLESFISRTDEEQTETLIPAKTPNPAVQTVKAAIANRDSAVTEEDFKNQLVQALRALGIPQALSHNAAFRAWNTRQTQMANEARKAAAAAEARNTNTADQILSQLAKLQSDTPSLTPPQVNPVRELIRQAMDPKQMWQKSALVQALTDLNVEPSLAARLTDAVWTQRQNNAQATVAQVQRGLAEGTRGSLKPLEDALIAAPATKQQHPGWRQKTMVDYFTQLGLNPQQAAAAARIYDREFAARLQDALEGAIEKVASTRAPWAPHAPQPVRKRAQTDLDKLRKAVRLGVVDPNSNWHFDLARSNGWKGFTPEQFKRLAEIDDHLFDEDLSAFKKAELKQEVINMVRKAGLPPTKIDYVAASFGISGLTGLPTFFVQLAGPINLIYKWMNDFPTNPVVSTRTILASMQTFAAEVRKAYKSGVYTHAVGENLAIGSIEPLEHLMEKGIENYEKGGKSAAIGFVWMLVGMQKWVAHVFNTIDQASYAAAKIYAHTLFTAKELRQLGWTREAAGAFVLDALEGRRDTYDQLVLDGMRPDEAQITADEDFTRILNGKVPGMEDIASNEALGPIGRMGVRPEVLGERTRKGRTDQPGQRLRVIDEGAVRQIVGALIYGIDYQLAKGGAAMMGVRAVFGYIKIPFNAAVWLSNYTAYGYVRLAIDHRRRNQGKETLWKQSMAHRVQIQQRKRDAAAGLIMQGAMLGLGLLAGSSGDDDEDKSELKIYFTGRGPDDKAQRQAWMKKFKPYSITLKTGKMYTPINVGRMFETLGWQAALAGAVDDMRLNEKRGSPSFNQVADLVGSYIGSLTMRSSFQGLSMDMGGRQPSAVTEWVAHKGIFAASSFVPWKGAVMSLSRMIKDPPDQKTLIGMVQANTPFFYFTGKPSLNVFGDTIRDASFSGIAYREGIPLIPRFPTSKRDRVFYDLVLKHGRGPSIIDKGDVSKYQGVTNEKLYNYGRIRGQMMKNEIIENAAEWNAYDTIEYRQALEQMARAINPEAAEKAGLERAWE